MLAKQNNQVKDDLRIANKIEKMLEQIRLIDKMDWKNIDIKDLDELRKLRVPLTRLLDKYKSISK